MEHTKAKPEIKYHFFPPFRNANRPRVIKNVPALTSHPPLEKCKCQGLIAKNRAESSAKPLFWGNNLFAKPQTRMTVPTPNKTPGNLTASSVKPKTATKGNTK